MSAYLCDAKTIGFVANLSGIPAYDIARLNLKAVAWRYRMTPKEVAKEFLGYSTLKQFLNDCQVEQSNPSLFMPSGRLMEIYRDKLEEIIYQCSEGDCVEDSTYKQLKRAI